MYQTTEETVFFHTLETWKVLLLCMIFYHKYTYIQIVLLRGEKAN